MGACKYLVLAMSVMIGGPSSGCLSHDDPPSPEERTAAASMPVTSAASPVCVTLERGVLGDIADTLIDATSTDENWGTWTALRVSKYEQSLLRFDLGSLPSSAIVSSATLDLYVDGVSTQTPVDFHAITAAWSEDTVTWSSFGEQYVRSPLAGVLPVAKANRYNAVDLTAIVQAWVSGQANDGVLAETTPSTKSGAVLFASSESGVAFAPKLTVCYQAGGCADVTCVAADHCHAAGVCDPQTGACSNPGLAGVPGCGPTLYADSQHEGPVRGDPGDVLLLAGTNFQPGATVVVYALGAGLPTPSALPASTSAAAGRITPLTIDANAVSVLLPQVMSAGQSYELWAATPDPENPGAYLFSNPVEINDARPMWLSPGPQASAAQPSYPYVFTTANRPGLGRTVKVMGRNLEPAPGHVTEVQLTAPGSSPMTLVTTPSSNLAIDRYAAQVTLPAMPLVNGQATSYTIAVSRDGVTWVPLPTPLTVLPDPPPLASSSTATCPLPRSPSSFYPGDYADAGNPCDPCDDLDDTLCISRAIQAAEQYVTQQQTVSPGLGAAADVVFSTPTCANDRAATWRVAANCSPEQTASLEDTYFGAPYVVCNLIWGIPVPPGVNLVADPCAATQPIIETEQGFDQPLFDFVSAFATCGSIGACCSTDSDCCSSGVAQVCVLEPTSCGSSCSAGGGASSVGQCQLRGPDNRQWLFDLQGQNLVQGLHIRDAYQPALETVVVPDGCATSVSAPGGNGVLISGNDVTITGTWLDDTLYGVTLTPPSEALPDGSSGNMDIVITGNQLGSYDSAVLTDTVEDSVIANNTFWPGASSAPIALGILGSRRLDVSGNLFDGSATPQAMAYSGGSTGFRAGAFFPLGSSHENLLVAGNSLRCAGIRPYQDGEGIAFDANLDTPGLPSSAAVVASPPPGPTEVSIGWPVPESPPGSPSPSSYVGRWLQVEFGPGVGQTRKIMAASALTTTLTFTVSPAFDVPPVAGQSMVLVLNQVWQANIVGNVIDNGVSTCFPSTAQPPDLTNLPAASSGSIALAGASADVAVDSNVQTDTAGISVRSTYAYWTGGGAPPYSYQAPEYFIDIRGNTIAGQFGGAGNPENPFGGGILLATLSGTLLDGVPQANPNWPGFGISVSHNTLANAATATPRFCPLVSAGIALAPFQAGDQSTTPGWVDTLVFDNNLTGTATSAGLSFSSAILNGCYDGVPNYPSGTVICGNVYSSFTSLYSDWPPPGGASSLNATCGE